MRLLRAAHQHQQILHIENAHDLIHRFAVHGHSAASAGQGGLHGLPAGHIFLKGGHVGAVGHDVPGGHVRQFHHAVDHFGLVIVDDLLLTCIVHQVQQLFLGDGFLIAQAPQPVGQGREPAGQACALFGGGPAQNQKDKRADDAAGGVGCNAA